MKLILSAIALVIGSTGIAGGASAQDNSASVESGPSVRFEAATGPVTVTSVQPALPNASDYQVRVSDVDSNGDGYIQRSEIPAGHALESEFKLVDSNADGRISANELAAWK